MTEARALAPDAVAPPLTPGQLFWRQFRRSPLAIWGGAMLLVLYVVALLAQEVGRGDAEQAGAENDDFHERALQGGMARTATEVDVRLPLPLSLVPERFSRALRAGPCSFGASRA